MRMKIDVTLDYALESPGPALLLIEAAGVHGQILNRTNIDLGQPLKLARVPAEEGIGERIVMRLQDRLTCRYSAEVQVTRPRPDLASLQAVEVEDMPGDALRYLLPSRYCQSERFRSFHRLSVRGADRAARWSPRCAIGWNATWTMSPEPATGTQRRRTPSWTGAASAGTMRIC